MTCYNPYNWNIEVNGKKWKFGTLEIDGKKEDVWVLESTKGNIVIKNDKDLKKNLSFFSQCTLAQIPRPSFQSIVMNDEGLKKYTHFQ